MVTKKYELKTEKDKMIFKTSSFKAEKTSVLHAGVYTKEFASILLASALCIFAYMLSDFAGLQSKVARYIMVMFILITTFLGSRKFIFKEKYLEINFDKSARWVTIIRHGIISRKTERIPFANIKSVDLGSKKFVPENIDGIDFVQKISAQHGSAVPGLSEVEEFVTLALNLKDGSDRIIFAVKIDGGKIDGEPYIPVKEIRSFLISNHE